jgi:hypothetical protein
MRSVRQAPGYCKKYFVMKITTGTKPKTIVFTTNIFFGKKTLKIHADFLPFPLK